MAPHTKNFSAQSDSRIQLQIEDEPSDEIDNKKSDKNNNHHDWKERLVVRLRRWLEADEDGYSGRYRLIATTILTFAAISLYKYRKNKRLARLWPTLLTLFQRPDYRKATDASLSLLRTSASQGLVQRALVGSSQIIFQQTGGEWRTSKLPPNSPSLQSELLEMLATGGCSEVSALPESIWSQLATPVLTALPFVYLALVYKIFKNMHGGTDTIVSKSTGSNQKGKTTFAHVAGVDSTIQEVQELVWYLADPSRYQTLGALPPRGVLLHGPPGSGKTLLARAVAGEANCETFIACSGSDFCEMYVGRGAARVRALFEQARQEARRKQRSNRGGWWWKTSTSSPQRPATAIIFIDELDALAKSRSYGGPGGNDERDQTLNQLLTEMDGFPSETDVTMIVIGASNRAGRCNQLLLYFGRVCNECVVQLQASYLFLLILDVLDPAILRRFDRQIHVGYPDDAGRRDIFQIHARRIQCPMEQVDWEYLASDELTDNFSGADIRNIVNDAALLAVRDQSVEVKQYHLLHAIRRASAMKGNLSSSSRNTNPNHFPFVLPQF
jgi:cell division protease FtsH